MYASVDCGPCASSISMDSEWEESTWLLVNRFSAAHVQCGTFTETTEMPVRPDYLDSPYEDEDEDEDEGSVEEHVE